MTFKPLEIPDVKLITPNVFGDERGYFKETFRRHLFDEQGIYEDFVQDNCSMSKKGAVRGLHYQIERPQAKIVMVAKGRVLDVAVDIRKSSPTFGQYVSMELSDSNHNMLYVPTGFAHGFAVLSDEAVFLYKTSDYYHPEGERGIKWNDTDIGIDWKFEDPIISEKDQNWPSLDEIPEQDLFK